MASVLCFLSPSLFAQADTIGRNASLNTQYLAPGLRQYLVYYVNPATPKKITCWLWLRNTTATTYEGKPALRTEQHWFGSDTLNYREYESINAADDFQPCYHSETARGETKAYHWSKIGIRGNDSVAGNKAASYRLDFPTPTLNWNLDIETFQMLPLAAGKTFFINFYDAGLDPPRYVKYAVTGSDRLRIHGHESIDCWKLFTESDHNGVHYTETFWISKKEHEFLKEEDSFNGMFRFKLRLFDAAPVLQK